MDYFKTNLRASAPAVLVVSRYLASQSGGCTTAELQGALQPASMIKQTLVRESPLGPSINAGEDLSVFVKADREKQSSWRLGADVTPEMLNDTQRGVRAFYNHLLRNLGARALVAVEKHEPLSDIAVALTWLSQVDPLMSFSTTWDDGPSEIIKFAGLRDDVIQNEYQWRAFYRWSEVLGVAVTTSATAKKVIMTDCTKAIEGALEMLPRRAPADQWLRKLWSLLPMLGHPALLSQLPVKPESSGVVAGSISLALLKLERMGRLILIPAADAAGAVVLRLGNQTTRVGEIRQEETP